MKDFMKYLIIITFCFYGCSMNYPLEHQMEKCVKELLDKAPETRYVNGKFAEITDFCEKFIELKIIKRKSNMKYLLLSGLLFVGCKQKTDCFEDCVTAQMNYGNVIDKANEVCLKICPSQEGDKK